ncbi:hypothetical protein MNB_SV-3-134 [hydrothermal vent metagenome]|uniref:Uncharacterized protein n=1 Tax=hydrothermal vent metagenome TaxID=652676 RepID=A0A1W1BQ97_9ZZZZ
MSNYEIITKAYGITEEESEQLTKRHTYIDEKLILDLVNGVGVVAKDLNDSAKGKEKGISRVWDSVSGNAKKRQNQINENVVEGLKSAVEWLQDHDRHLTRMDFKIKDIADELYKTQGEILKFYGQFKEVDFRVELLENFKKSAEQRFENIEERLKKIEAQQQIDREVSKLCHLDLPIEVEIFTILDNLASGEFGLWIMFEKDSKKKEEQITYLKRKIKEKLKIEGKEYLDFKNLSSEINRLESIEKKAIEFMSKQYRSFEDENSYEIIDLIALSATNTPDEVEKVIDTQTHIRTFMTYNDYVDALTDELVGESV